MSIKKALTNTELEITQNLHPFANDEYYRGKKRRTDHQYAN